MRYSSLARLRAAPVCAWLCCLSCLSLAVAGSSACHSESLPETLRDTYFFSPQLEAARATLRANDEEVARANSGYRPNIAFSADVGRVDNFSRPDIGTTGTTTSRGFSLQLTQNIFRGFQTLNAVNVAEATVRAERETLRQTEQQVLLEAVTAFADVQRDAAILKIREANLRFYKTQLEANRQNLAVKEVTRTDVAQSEARVAQGRADLEAARTNLDSSSADFERVVGHRPQLPLRGSSLGPALPKSLDQAVAAALQDNPQVVGALYREQAANFLVDQTRGELLPDAQIEANYGQRFDTDRRIEASDTASVIGRLTVPIYPAGGEVYARIRRTKHEHVSRLQQIDQTRNMIKAQVIQFWSQIRGLRTEISAIEVQIKANIVALDGVRSEQKVGQRTIVEVLDAQRELNNSQVQLEMSRRNLIVANFSIVSALGRLSVADLGLSSSVYDETAHYAEVRELPWGEDITAGTAAAAAAKPKPPRR